MERHVLIKEPPVAFLRRWRDGGIAWRKTSAANLFRLVLEGAIGPTGERRALVDSNRESSLDIALGAAVDSMTPSEAASGPLPGSISNFDIPGCAGSLQAIFLGRGNEFMRSSSRLIRVRYDQRYPVRCLPGCGRRRTLR